VLLVAGFDLAVAMVFPRDVALVRVCQKKYTPGPLVIPDVMSICINTLPPRVVTDDNKRPTG
jgi:hypothetical protein